MGATPVLTPPPQAPNVRGLVADPEFERLTPELQRATLAKVTGDQAFLKLTDGETSAFTQKLGAAASPSQPGALSFLQDQPGQSPVRRFLQGAARPLLGLPVGALQTLNALSHNPGAAAKQILVSQPAQAAAQLNADEPMKPWNSVGNDIGNILSLPGNAVTRIPVIGPFAEQITRELTHGDIAGGSGELVGGLLAPEEMKLAKKIPGAISDAATSARDSGAGSAFLGPRANGVDPVQGVVRALRARNSVKSFPQKVAMALPDVRQGLDELGIDPKQMNVRDIEPAIAKAKSNVWNEWAQRFYGPNAHVELGMQPVASAIVETAERMSKLTRSENPALMQKIAGTAAFYDGQKMPISEVESRIQDLNNELRSAQAQFKVNKNALMNSPQFAYRFAELNALRRIEADAFDRISGPGAAALKQRYGALNVLQDVADRRIGVIERQASDKLFGGLGKLAGGANLAAGTFSALTGRFATAGDQIARGAAEWKIGRNLQKMYDPEFLLRAALSKTAPRGPYIPEAPVAPRIAGLLGSGEAAPQPAPEVAPPGNVNPIRPKAFLGGGVVRDASGRMTRVPTQEVPVGRNPLVPEIPKPDAATGRFTFKLVRDPKTGRMRKVLQ